MGFDIEGVNPRSEAGEYFRNSIWSWHPLWDFVCEAASGIITEEERKSGHFNDGLYINKEKAIEVAQRLRETTGQKDFWKKFIQRQKNRNEFKELEERYTKIKEIKTCEFLFSWENVAKFAKFCEESGGFRIW